MKNRMRIIPVLLGAALLLGGCGAEVLPGMSDYDYDRFVNYTSGLLVRYNKGSADKLTYLDTSYTPAYLLTQLEGAAPAQEETTPPAEEEPPAPQTVTEPVQEPAKEPAETPEAVPAEEPAEGGTEDGTLPAEGENTETGIEVENLTAIDESRLQSLANGVSVEYVGYSVRNSYPDAQAQGAVIAAPGDKLLIVDFRLRNMTGEMANVNTAYMGPQYKLLINGDVQGFTLVTMIENDLSSLLTVIPAGGYLDAVLLMELPEDLARNVESLSLIVQYGTDAQTIRLE